MNEQSQSHYEMNTYFPKRKIFIDADLECAKNYLYRPG